MYLTNESRLTLLVEISRNSRLGLFFDSSFIAVVQNLHSPPHSQTTVDFIARTSLTVDRIVSSSINIGVFEA